MLTFERRDVIQGMPSWTARVREFAFIIFEDDGGFSASWKDATSTERQSARRLDNGAYFPTLEAAQKACEQQASKLSQ